MTGTAGNRGARRLLLLALDAVPYRVVRAAVDAGAFDEWTTPSVLVAPFPSVTHVAFASLFAPWGVEPSWGYEVRYFDAAANRTVGGNPLTYRNRVPPWAEYLDAPHRGVVSKVSNYVSSPFAAGLEFDEIAAVVLASPLRVVVGYLGATDGLLHLYDDDAAAEVVVDLGRRLQALRQTHQAERGVPLDVVLFSDHGCGRAPVHYTGSLKPLLRDAGLHVVEHLSGPDDVAAPTFGIVNYGALFLQDAGRAEAAARAVLAHEGVELAAYAVAPDAVAVLARTGSAVVRRRTTSAGPSFRCEDHGGDVLRLAAARASLAATGRLDADGSATASDWLCHSAFASYPDPLRRLVDALTGDRIASRATVLLSLGPGWSWGWRSAFAGGLVRGGRLKGTHGGLDIGSSLGFVMSSDPGRRTPPVVWADAALAPFADLVRTEHPHRAAG